MKNAKHKILLVAVFSGLMILLIQSYGAALEPIKLGCDSELNIYGFVRQNAGMFLQNPQPFAHSSNDIATLRTWFRAYTDLRFSKQFRFGSVIQFAYEPEYDVEDDAGGSYDTPVDPLSREDGKEYSEYKNVNDVVREVFVEWKPSRAHTFKVGRQIVIWGEALTTRVGDVIHPEDQRFTLAFANLEDTRIPSWMLRVIHEFSSISSSFEWLVNPNLVEDKYRVNRLAHFISLGQPGQRFSINPETRFDPPFSVGNPFLGGPFTDPAVVVPHPFSRDWISVPGVPGTGWVPTALPFVTVDYPDQWDLRGGFRTNTTLAGFNFGVSYFHTQEYNPVIKRGDLTGAFDPFTGIPFRSYKLVFPDIDIIGAYFNKDLAVIPGVIRFDAIYVPNKPFNTFDTTVFDAIVRRDYVKYMIAYDLSGYLYFPWHKTAPFDITLEHINEWIPDNDDIQYISYSTEAKEWNPSFNMRVVTNWRYNQISTEVIASYIPWAHSGLLMPIIKYVPPVLNNQVSFEARYINVFANSDFAGLGILRNKDMIVLTAQLNW